MSTDFESREQSLYESLLESAKTPKAKACLFNVRKACSSILKVKGNLTYAAVARFIDDVDNLEILQLINGVAGPKQQSISNNKNFKEAIEFASLVAGISVTREGAANSMPTIDEIEENL